MRVFPTVETPSMAPMWRKMREIRAMVTKHPPKDMQQRFSASSWRKSSAQDAAKRFSSATSYLAAVSVKAHRKSSVAKFTLVSELEKATDIHEFELLDVLGRGSFGSVHLARHLDTGATVAIKVFPEDYEQGHPAVCSLIQKLLEKDPALRVASFSEVKKMTFFRTYFPSTQGWQQLEARQMEPPFTPRLDGPFDTSLFVRVQDEKEQDYGSDADSDFGY
ncbi:hypothetical protein PC123_g8673 [Phytophthora cactorum]|nr:hypothetical protein PC123_g8673 [Phytophthora cactorum]